MGVLLVNLGDVQLALERAEAEKTFREALRIFSLAENAERELAFARGGLGRVLAAQGRDEESIPLLRQAIETSQQRDVGTAATWARLALATTLERQGAASEEIDELRSVALQGCAGVPPTQQDDCRREAGG